MMMQTVLSSVLLDVPLAAVIWLTILGVAIVTVVALVSRPDRFRAGERIRRAVLPTDPELTRQQRELDRYTEEVRVAAERATATAQRLRGEWLTAQEEVESLWQAYEKAEAHLRRLGSAAAMPLPSTPRTPAEYADRERFLHRAATAAYERGELTDEQLADALAHRNGWDPRLHPVAQEVVLRRVLRDTVLARHRAAAERERAAWRAAELAATAARSLRDEAFAAAERVPETPDVLPLTEAFQPVTAAEPRPARHHDLPHGRAAVA